MNSNNRKKFLREINVQLIKTFAGIFTALHKRYESFRHNSTFGDSKEQMRFNQSG